MFLSLFKQAPFGRKRIFVGIQNYINLFQDPAYLNSLLRSTLFIIFTITIGLVFSLLLAVILNQNLKGIKFYRVIFFIPYAISPTVAGSLWVFLLNPVAGQVNYLLDLAFNIQVNWLTNSFFAFLAIIIATVWKNMGFNIIFFLAGLQAIPDSVYESAKIDGAGAITIFKDITIPLLSPTTFYLIIMNIIFSVFESFGIVDIMTQGGPADSTNIVIYKLYREMFINFRPGIAAAQSVILLALVIIVTIFHFKYGANNVHYQ
ncbi:MAG: sn-glycerol 3-phosphate transport system permease protein [Halanaerobium sp. 4-GBenrich]|nr:MAG: sn-glycerol 3-phosphate transport system permease protein [Halanaerobium sp. 4-GBenrich]PUU91336.1 MAG: sn-glycerol 3-phosphate transport system permease protein [Halanaerobium sp.]